MVRMCRSFIAAGARKQQLFSPIIATFFCAALLSGAEVAVDDDGAPVVRADDGPQADESNGGGRFLVPPKQTPIATSLTGNSGTASKSAEESDSRPYSSKPTDQGAAPKRRLVSAAVVNLVVNSVVFPQMYDPLVASIRSISQSINKPHEKHWAPQMEWDLSSCQLVVDYSNGYSNEQIKKVSTQTFGVYFSRKSGRVSIRWSDRNKASRLWTKPRMELSTVLSSAWCKFDDTAYANIFTAEGGVQAAVVQFMRLEANSYKNATIMSEDEFQPLLNSHFVSDHERDAFKEALIPEKNLGWDADRCMFQLIHRGPPGSHIVQWNDQSMRGLFRIIDVPKRTVVVNREMHPRCTYDYGKVLQVGEVTLRDGRRKIIGFLQPIVYSDIQNPSDLTQVPIRNVKDIRQIMEEEDKAREAAEQREEMKKRRERGELPPSKEELEEREAEKKKEKKAL